MPSDVLGEKSAGRMIVAVGADLVEITRIRKILERTRESFLARAFTESERAYCETRGDPADSLAGRFAAKEAVMKCLGTGWSQGVGFRQIEVVRSAEGAVGIALTGRAAELAAERGIARIHVSISHSGGQALAFAVAERA